MHAKAELSGRRLLLALVLLTLIPGTLAVGAIAYQRPDLPPGPADYNPTPLAKEPVATALQARELQRSRRATAEAASLGGPELLPARFPEPIPTLVLPPRETPYSLADVQGSMPAAFSAVDNAVLVQASIEVPSGAHLLIDGATPDVRMASSPDGFATIIARGGSVDISGTAERPVRITSWNRLAEAPDADPSDGRAFLLTFGGAMNITHADIGHLGFGTGTSSGVAWRGEEHTDAAMGEPARGSVTSSVLHDNWFGAYTFEAEGMHWNANTFADNSAYGFDPHDFSNHFLVEDNVAYGNGRHGFIFSRGCQGNVLRNNTAYDNRGHGFMIDDGRSEDTGTAQAAVATSDDNKVVDNHAYDNDGSGIEIEGGSDNVVKGNLLERNHVGVRVKDDASVSVEDNVVVDSRLFGIDILQHGPSVVLSGNSIRGAWGGISLMTDGSAELAGNDVSEAAAPMVVDGVAIRSNPVVTTVSRYFKWNPLLILWSTILGVPTFLAVKALFSRVVARRARGAVAYER